MYAFSARIDVAAGATLAGFSDRMDVPTTMAGVLEVHGIGNVALGWKVCAIDALYAGVLSRNANADSQRIFAASHTHYAPLLDDTKPALGNYDPTWPALYEAALDEASRTDVSPDLCTLYVGQVDVPVYRRFDYPESALNRFLSKHAGRYPNDAHPVDRNVYIFSFSREGLVLFSIVYHACHPVTRHSGEAASADYVGALRNAVAARWGSIPCLFFQGCAGDVRPNLAEKRAAWLPRSRFNWRFKPELSFEDELTVDRKYRRAVEGAAERVKFALTDDDIRVLSRTVPVSGLGYVSVPELRLGEDVVFAFLPFEVSHRYQLETEALPAPPHRFIVSCANDVRGYLPHAGQHSFGGYEVESSRAPMGLDQVISMESQDLWQSR